jgi:NAD(P)-dependent dehydrogenase (short-subunit alcohol dehydrogenase family)
MSGRIDHRSIMSRRRADRAAIVVTGAAGGIGGGIVRHLLADGWHVVATDLSADALETLRDGGQDAVLSLAPLDVSDSAAVSALAADLNARGVGVAGLVNTAGLLQDITPFMAMDDAAHRRIWDVNYFGALACTRAFGASIMTGGGGSIVNITSINAIRPLPLHAYAPTKVALGSLTSLTAGEFGRAGLRVNAVAPGFTLTPIMRAKIEGGLRDDSAIRQATAMGRLVEIEEIAAVVGFLMSDAASAVSGASIPVDAGWLATSHWMNFGSALA